jgi:endonuclease/exonuclease/phosphatase family metal-dependent hydrolase
MDHAFVNRPRACNAPHAWAITIEQEAEMHHGNVPKEVAKGLMVLRQRIRAAEIPSSKLDETLNIATWNIREFGRRARDDAAIHYIAEILGQFDVIGIVELRDNLSDLHRALEILGPYWRAVYSDMIPDPGGNRERVAYIYDKRAVVFTGFAATGTPPRVKKGTEYLPEQSWWRPPYVASWKAGNFDFLTVTAHVRWGSSRAKRQEELALLANWIDAKRTERFAVDKDILVMGDFNIENDEMLATITRKGLRLPRALVGKDLGSNLAKNKRYDQILHYPTYPENFTNAGGVLDYYVGDHKPLFPKLTKTAFTYQLSDHLPLWLQINTAIDDFKLEQIIGGAWRRG